MKRSKAYQNADTKIDHEQLYSPVDAVDLAKATQVTKFDPTVEVNLRLGVDRAVELFVVDLGVGVLIRLAALHDALPEVEVVVVGTRARPCHLKIEKERFSRTVPADSQPKTPSPRP